MHATVYGVEDRAGIGADAGLGAGDVAGAGERGDGSGGAWRWCVSIAPEADVLWWRRRGAKALWVVIGRLSLGQALTLRASLVSQRRGRGTLHRAAPGRNGRWVALEDAGTELGIEAGWKPDDGLYETWMRRLEGRLFLREEIERMDHVPQPWAAYTQWGALEGRLRIRCGAERDKDAANRGRWVALAGGLLRSIGAARNGSGASGASGGPAREDDSRWRGYRCVRCGSGPPALRVTDCALCGGPCPYCEACLTMGRVRYCALLVQGAAGASAQAHDRAAEPLEDVTPKERWGLSAAQADAAGAALRYLRQPKERKFMLWAVTGAGKTEMMFPLVERTLSSGGRALVATPRKDVVLELAPRFKAAFPNTRVVTLYGGSEERWDAGAVTIATTHQLFRFREAFELVVLDEIDAFPYHGDPQLAYAAERARMPGGAFVLLTATPPAALRRDAKRGLLPHARVCARFHGHPLPVPRRLAAPPLRRWAVSGALPRALRDAIAGSLARGAQLFLFVPRIDVIPAVLNLLTAAFPDTPIGGTSSKDDERTEKVLAFRDSQLRIIVTTTILERGVTVPKTDVFVLDADSALFDMASLVQMAGRAGRKADDPRGRVWFCSADWTSSQKEAIRDIRSMNAEARRKGYVIHGTSESS